MFGANKSNFSNYKNKSAFQSNRKSACGMDDEEGEGPPRAAARHIKKRALKNNALSISFNDKDLRDYVTGFHKRKKKRRKEAQRKVQEKERLKRIEARKKRKLEREFALYGGTVPVENPSGTGSGPDEHASGDIEEDEGLEPNASVSGTKVYDNGDTTIMVTTSAISHEEDELKATHIIPKLSGEEKRQHSFPAKKKPFKKVAKQRSRKKPKKSTSQKKGNKKGRNKL